MMNLFIRVDGCQIFYGRPQSEASKTGQRAGGMRDDSFIWLHCLLPVCINMELIEHSWQLQISGRRFLRADLDPSCTHTYLGTI